MFFSGQSIKTGKKVIKDLFYFSENQMLDCNQYLIHDTDKDELILFDAGNGKSLSGLFDGMKKLGFSYENIRKIYLTHEHIDHVLGLYSLMEKLKNDPPEIFAYTTTAKILQGGEREKIFPGNLGISPEMFGVNIKPLNVIELTPSDTIKIASSFSFQIYHTPGHSEGSIVYYEPNKKILIAGDLVFIGGSFGRYDFPDGSLKKLTKSIEFVNNLDVKYLLPGHMGISNEGNEQTQYSTRMVKSIGSYY
jgi:glyoxylase-like metal-dependent hydrolase (beta-lactamase superfamily II)